FQEGAFTLESDTLAEKVQFASDLVVVVGCAKKSGAGSGEKTRSGGIRVSGSCWVIEFVESLALQLIESRVVNTFLD
ncbi:MAG TPA: hypothetical protein VHO90_07385, partial [Bacteroidales bacterium]|nr:hypothetical protein [Bacteroidales bacterium]